MNGVSATAVFTAPYDSGPHILTPKRDLFKHITVEVHRFTLGLSSPKHNRASVTVENELNEKRHSSFCINLHITIARSTQHLFID